MHVHVARGIVAKTSANMVGRILRENGITFLRTKVKPIHGHTWQKAGHPSGIRATHNRLHGVRHYISAYDLAADKLVMRLLPAQAMAGVPQLSEDSSTPPPQPTAALRRAGQLLAAPSPGGEHLGGPQQHRFRVLID